MANEAPITLAALFRYYSKDRPHQTAAISELELDLLAHGYGVAMRRDRPWFKTWSQAGKQTDPAAQEFANSWEGVTAAATAAGAKYPELVAAQWALESGWGTSTSGRNNYFGIKGKGTTRKTTEFVNGARVHIDAEFQDFADLGACVSYLVTRWHKDFKSYKGVNSAANRELAAKELVRQGYATDPSYAEKLIKLMNQSKPNPVSVNVAGPKKTPQDFGFKAGDSHIIVSDLSETAKAYNFKGALLWEVAALGRGQSTENDWQSRNSDTPPGIYRIGQVYDDWARYGNNPPNTSDVLAYGWLSFDLIGLEGQEWPGSRNGRDGIMVHGGGSACGFPGCWLQIQPLHSTYGCVRMHNIDLRDKLLPLVKAGTVFVSVFQER
jgi:hypothetical protein